MCTPSQTNIIIDIFYIHILLKLVNRQIRLETGEPRSTDYLLQRLSIAIQRRNSVSVYGGITT